MDTPPVGLQINQSKRAYESDMGPFHPMNCVMCGRPIGNGARSVGVRIDNPSLRLQIVGGEPEDRDNGCHFNVHIGLACLRKAMGESASC